MALASLRLDLDDAFARATSSAKPTTVVDLSSYFQVDERFKLRANQTSSSETKLTATASVLSEQAFYAVRIDRPARVLLGSVQQVPLELLFAARARMRRLCADVMSVADGIASRLGVGVLVVFNARGGTPLAHSGRAALAKRYSLLRSSGAPRGAVFGTRSGEEEALGWFVSQDGRAASLPVSHFKISSRRFVTSADSVLTFGDPRSESWRLRKSWSACLEETREYIPAGFLQACNAGVPIIFADIASRRSGLSTACGIPQTDAEHARDHSDARDPYKLAPLLISVFDYRMFATRHPANESACEKLAAILPQRGWCLAMNAGDREDGEFWDNRPQLVEDWGGLYSEYSCGVGQGYRFVDESGRDGWVPNGVVGFQ